MNSKEAITIGLKGSDYEELHTHILLRIRSAFHKPARKENKVHHHSRHFTLILFRYIPTHVAARLF